MTQGTLQRVPVAPPGVGGGRWPQAPLLSPPVPQQLLPVSITREDPGFSEFLEERSLEGLQSIPVTKLTLPGALPNPPHGPAAPGPPGTWGHVGRVPWPLSGASET